MMYSALYESHDSTLAARETQRAFEEEREAKRRVLQTSYEDLAELPALSSFLMIREASDAAQTGCSTNGSDREASSIKNAQRDGFERIKRCRLALDALDQVCFIFRN